MTSDDPPGARHLALDGGELCSSGCSSGELNPPAFSQAGQRFGKAERLLSRGDFLLVQQRGKRIHLRDLLVFLLPRPGVRRMGITASSKVGGAVQRNRIKRLLREVWRRHREELPLGNDIVFVAKRSAVKLTYQEFCRQFVELSVRLRRRECHHEQHHL